MKSSEADSLNSTGAFIVVVNHEEQYALWPANKPIPDKWQKAGMAGTKEECRAFVSRVWTDMRPLSIRKRASAPPIG
jgi:MbtH protein